MHSAPLRQIPCSDEYSHALDDLPCSTTPRKHAAWFSGSSPPLSAGSTSVWPSSCGVLSPSFTFLSVAHSVRTSSWFSILPIAHDLVYIYSDLGGFGQIASSWPMVTMRHQDGFCSDVRTRHRKERETADTRAPPVGAPSRGWAGWHSESRSSEGGISRCRCLVSLFSVFCFQIPILIQV
jgi:hypothetical protein